MIDNTGAAGETIYVDSTGLNFNPSSNTLIVTSQTYASANPIWIWSGVDADSTTNFGSTGIGYNTLTFQGSGFTGGAFADNTAVGFESQNVAYGARNTSLGYRSLYTYDTEAESSGNVAIGALALYGDSGTPNTVNGTVAIGYRALRDGGGVNNIAIGIDAARDGVLTGFTNNILLGNGVMINGGGGDGSDNIIIGRAAFLNPSNSSDNIAIGTSTLAAITTGDLNIVIGGQAGDSITTGANNLLLGNGAGSNITTGTDNFIIGPYPGKSATNSRNIVISTYEGVPVLFSTGSNGNVGIFTDNPQFTFHVSGSAGGTGGTLGARLSTAADNSNIVSINRSTDEIQYTPSMSIDTNALNPSGSGGVNTNTYLVLNNGYSINNEIEYGYFERISLVNGPPTTYVLLTIPQTTYYSVVIDYTTSDSSYAFTRSQRFICHWDNGTGITYTNSGAPDLGSINVDHILKGIISGGNIQIRLTNYLSSGRIIGDYKLFKKI
jgi:hypothetical protein